jgi:hypothetical protein
MIVKGINIRLYIKDLIYYNNVILHNFNHTLHYSYYLCKLPIL